MQRRTLLSRLAFLPALAGLAARARGVTEQDLTQWGAKFGNPTIFVGLVEWADRIITE